ncbi:MAG TPA: SprT family zinc-dependent metalloprotease [Bacteroidota bacterium]|nr:SprT family zinc-dependent metalloprotease [Bacteroidota bacterium]
MVGEREIPFVVRPSARARRVSLRIREAGLVEVVVPMHHLVPTPESVLRHHASWILRTFDRLRRSGGMAGLQSVGDGSRILFLGTERTISVLREQRRRPLITLDESRIVIRLTPESPEDVRPLLSRWMRARAETIIPLRVDELNEPWRFRYSAVTVRNQRTRWGSCSRRGALSFNWRLVILPTEVADYLICHELAHLKHLDHSHRFWKLVETLCPSYRQSERWLRKHGRSVLL